MNSRLPPAQPAHTRRAFRFWLSALVFLLACLVLVEVVPAWAAGGPVDIRQGTVPLPPGGGGDDDNNDDTSPGQATPTPVVNSGPAATPIPVTTGVALDVGTGVAPANVTGVVTALKLNVRSGPGATNPVVGSVVQNQVLTIQYRNAAGDWWYSCCISGTTTSGWVSALFVRPDFDAAKANTLIPVAPALASAPVATRVPITGTAGIVDVFRLNLRSEPSTSGVILGKLLQNEVVEIEARNAAGDWWYVCCLAGTQTSGWVSAQFVTPAFSRAGANQILPVRGDEVHVVLPTPTPKPNATPSVSKASSTALTAASSTLPATTLGVLLVQEPPYAAPGEPIELRFVITNTGSVTATTVEVRNELRPELALGGGTAAKDGAFATSTTRAGTSVFTLTWPELAPGGEVTATVGITLSSALTEGTVLDTIAAVSAANAPAETTGIFIGLPPAALPDFQ